MIFTSDVRYGEKERERERKWGSERRGTLSSIFSYFTENELRTITGKFVSRSVEHYVRKIALDDFTFPVSASFPS